MSQQALADQIGFTKGRISQMERKGHGASKAAALAVCDHYRPMLHQLGITAEDLLRGKKVA